MRFSRKQKPRPDPRPNPLLTPRVKQPKLTGAGAALQKAALRGDPVIMVNVGGLGDIGRKVSALIPVAERHGYEYVRTHTNVLAGGLGSAFSAEFGRKTDTDQDKPKA